MIDLPEFHCHAWRLLAKRYDRTPEELKAAAVNVLRPGTFWPTLDIKIPHFHVGGGLTIAEYEELLQAMRADLDDMKAAAVAGSAVPQ